MAILVPEHAAFKTEILLFKPFQDKWLFKGCSLTLYSLKNEDPVIPLSNHYHAYCILLPCCRIHRGFNPAGSAIKDVSVAWAVI